MQKVLSTFRKAVEKYKLIEDGDKIAVGVSGGKDSLVLLKALVEFKKFGLYNYDILAVTIDNYSGEEDYSHLIRFCKELNVEYVIEKTDIKHVVFDLRKEKNPCSLCAKMRRGALNSVCQKYNCNKLALAHHLQDVTTTFFMSLFYEGRLNTMLPKTYMTNTKITLIRPLYLTEEKDIIRVSKNLPVKKSICPANNETKREEVKQIIENLNKQIPDLKKRITNAILDVESYNLLDKLNL